MTVPRKSPQQVHAEEIQRLKEVQEQLQKNQGRQDKRTRALSNVGAFQSRVLARAESWSRAAWRIGGAYATAAAKHREVVNNQKDADQLETQVLFSVLSALAAGGLSWLSSFAEYKQSAQTITLARTSSASSARQAAKVALDEPSPYTMVVEALEDSVQAGMGEAMTSIVPMIITPLFDAVNEEPLTYQDHMFSKLSTVKQMAFDAFAKIQSKIGKNSLESWDNYNESSQLKEHANWIKASVELIGDENLQSEDWIAVELERGMWRKFILDTKVLQK